jgi:proline iminopeptidase
MADPLPGLDIQPDAMDRIAVEGGEVMTYSFGSGDNVLLLVNGGPGLPCDYLRDSHSHLATKGFRVVTWDQLGTGRSQRPGDQSLWTIERYAREMEQVRAGIGGGKVHVLGQSWGGFLAIEHALAFPDGIRSLVLANTVADVPHLLAEQGRLRAALGSESVAMMLRREAEGTTGHPEYLAAVEILSWRHVHRLESTPAALKRSMDGIEMAIYGHMWGPNEFQCVGNLKNWNRLAELEAMDLPVMIVVGEHDELTPACAHRMHRRIAGSELCVIRNASHLPCFEQPETYFGLIEAFLGDH